LGNRDIIEHEEGKAVRKGTIVGKLFSEIGPRYLDRPGGYTRIIRLSLRRLGDNGQLVLLQLIGPEEGVKKEPKAGARKRGRRKKKGRIPAGEADEGGRTTEPARPAEAERTAETDHQENPAGAEQ